MTQERQKSDRSANQAQKDRPMVVVHNSISLDGSVVGFEVDMALHYRLAGTFGAQAHLIGSDTAIAGIKQFGSKKEKISDRQRPHDTLPPWVLIDSKAKLHSKLHAFRNTGFGGDPIVVVSKSTPRTYLNYLKTRDYRYHVAGQRQVNLRAALRLLHEKYNVKTLLVDSGPGLVGALLDKGLVDQISLLIVPRLVTTKPLRLFSKARQNIVLELQHQETVENGLLWCRYAVGKNQPT